MRIDIASFFIMRIDIASFFIMSHRYCIVFFRCRIDVASIIRRTPYFVHFASIFVTAHFVTAHSPCRLEMTGGGIPLLLCLRCIKKGECKTLCEKNFTPPQYCIVFIMRIDIASFFIIAHRYCIVFYNRTSILHRFL
jgi:hypothetical protein